MHLVLRLRGGGLGHTMGIAAGGKIEQTIARDSYNPDTWDKLTLTIPVHVLNSAAFRSVTGHNPPECPINASTYANANLPFFKLYEEPSAVYGAFDAVKSVNKIEQERGLADGSEPSVKPRVIRLVKDGHAVRTATQVDISKFVDDPDGLLNPAGPLREFRTLEGLQSELKSLTLGPDDKQRSEASSG